MTATSTENFAAIVTVRRIRSSIDTREFFDLTAEERNLSPIDQFIKNCVALNQHWVRLNDEQDVPRELGILLLLGYVSAVEGFMRLLLRKLIHLDPYTKLDCETLQVSYGAVMHHKADALPESLLEETVFSSGAEIKKAITKFLKMQNFTKATQNLIDEYDNICQLRHCCVHRFGKLGVKNAQVLGLSEHSKFLDKTILVQKKTLEDIADLFFAMTKSINNEVYEYTLKRTVTTKLPSKSKRGIGWKWDYAKDRSTFEKYYQIFASTLDATPSSSIDRQYELFKIECKSMAE